MRSNPLPSVELLNETFSYDASTGVLTWKFRPLGHFSSSSEMKRCNARFAGHEAGVINKNGYRMISVNSITYYAHRIIYKMMTGEDPTEAIDHRNGAEGDNRWENIRPATHQQNMCNGRDHKASRCGLKGVTFKLGRQKNFCAQIEVQGKHINLGCFSTAIEAHKAYCDAAKYYHGEYANLGKNSPFAEVTS